MFKLEIPPRVFVVCIWSVFGLASESGRLSNGSIGSEIEASRICGKIIAEQTRLSRIWILSPVESLSLTEMLHGWHAGSGSCTSETDVDYVG